MHKLKNKHTGEVITTPYLAEVEEYLNSGDYEMKETYADGQSHKEVDHKENTKRLFELNDFLMKHEFGVIGDSVVDTAIKLIKDAYIAKEKPIYTKEMHERGELPPVGSFVEVINYGKGEVKLEQDIHGYSCVLVNGEYHLIKQCEIKPIPTIEDEFKEFIRDSVTNMNIDELHKSILTKYNITPKES